MDRRSLAMGAGAFAVVFLVVAIVEGVVLSTRLGVALPVATVVGLGFGVLAYLRTARGTGR